MSNADGGRARACDPIVGGGLLIGVDSPFGNIVTRPACRLR